MFDAYTNVSTYIRVDSMLVLCFKLRSSGVAGSIDVHHTTTAVQRLHWPFSLMGAVYVVTLVEGMLQFVF